MRRQEQRFATSPPEDWGDIIKTDHYDSDPDATTEQFYIPTDLEAVAYTVEPKEAIECFQNRYPREALKAGMAKPEEATAMLVEISNKYGDVMTDEQQAFIKNRAAESVHQIVNDPDETPTIPTLYRMVDVVDLLDDDVATQNIAAMAEKDLKTALEAVRQNGGASEIRNIEKALEHYDDPDNSDFLGTLVANIETQKATRAQENLEIKLENDPQKYTLFHTNSGASSSEESTAEKLAGVA